MISTDLWTSLGDNFLPSKTGHIPLGWSENDQSENCHRAPQKAGDGWPILRTDLCIQTGQHFRPYGQRPRCRPLRKRPF